MKPLDRGAEIISSAGRITGIKARLKGISAEEGAYRLCFFWVQPEQACNCRHLHYDEALSGIGISVRGFCADAFYYIARLSGLQAGFYYFGIKSFLLSLNGKAKRFESGYLPGEIPAVNLKRQGEAE